MKTGRDTVIEALNLARMGNIGRACKLLDKMRDEPDLEADACYGLGLVELCQNNIDDSEAYFCIATRRDPAHVDAYYQLAKIASSRGDLVAATRYLKAALTQNPEHEMAAEALAEFGVVMEAPTGPTRSGHDAQPAGTNTRRRENYLDKCGLSWKTLISMITLAVLTVGVIQESAILL